MSHEHPISRKRLVAVGLSIGRIIGLLLVCAVVLAPVFYAVARLATKYLRYPPYFLCFCLSLLVSMLGAIYVIQQDKKAALTPIADEPHQHRKKRWAFALAALSILVYGGLSALLSTAWLKGDDFFSLNLIDIKLISRFFSAIDCYADWVSRNGDFIIRLTSFSENRWLLWLVNPLVVLLIPWGLWQLTARKGESIFSGKGTLFFLFAVPLALLSCKVFGEWRNYWCWAASANYLWPSTALLFFLSYYRQGRQVGMQVDSLSSACAAGGLFLLGWYVCSGCECLAVTVIPLLLLWLVCRIRNKKKVGAGCLMGILGSIWGAFFLFASPALFRRAQGCAESRPLDISAMSYPEILDYVQHLSHDKILQLVDGTDVINLSGIPLWLHVYFLPWLAERYGECCMFTGAVFVLLLLLSLKKAPARKQVWCGALVFAFLSCYAAISYLVGAIPSPMSFLPPVFFLLAGCAYLYLRLPYRWIPQAAFSMLVLTTALAIFIPSGMEAWQYKKYEQVRMDYIRDQKAKGNKDIVVPPLFPVPPQDKLGLIGGAWGGFSPAPEGYPNNMAAHYFGIETLSQK